MTTTSTGTRLDIRKLTARIGAEVAGVGPTLELDANTVTALRAALNEHKALYSVASASMTRASSASPATSAS